MKYAAVRCPNMNHGRLNAPVKYCPTCGDVVNRAALSNCNSSKHMSLRKNRHTFCHECGKNLAAAC